MRVQLPVAGQPADTIIKKACAHFKCEPWGGMSAFGWSKIGNFQQCMKRYYLREIRGLRSAIASSSPALDIGSYTHVGLAAYYAKMLPESYPGWQANTPDPLELIRQCMVEGGNMEALMMAEKLLAGYIEQYAQDEVIPVAVEMSIGNPEFHTARPDIIAHVEDGIHDGLWLWDHKTGSSATDWEAFNLNGEILGEMYAFIDGGYEDIFEAPLAGICINGLIKTGKAAPKFVRHWIPRNDILLTQFYKSRAFWNTQLTNRDLSNYWPEAYNGCSAKYGRCEFFDYCMHGDNESFVRPKETSEVADE